MLGVSRRCSLSASKAISSARFVPQYLRPFHPKAGLSGPQQASRLAPLARLLHSTPKRTQYAAAQAPEGVADESSSASKTQSPATRFEELGTRNLVHPTVVNTLIESMKLETMTEIQTATVQEGLAGVDIIAQAKTGTGKTLAFLIPLLQRILQEEPSLAHKSRERFSRANPSDIRALIISPTRELAEQISVEAKKLTAQTAVMVQTAVGGTQKRSMLQQLQMQGCHILVGTPGRLNDILSDPYSGVSAPKLSTLVLDEADRLLDDGFWGAIEAIKELLPDREKKDRQTLMFSATIPNEVVHIVRQTLKRGFRFIKTVQDDEQPTHARVPQKLVTVRSFENVLPALYQLCERAIEAGAKSGQPFKAIVYFPVTAAVGYAADAFTNLYSNNPSVWERSPQIWEIHAKLSQGQRTKAADSFRKAKSALLFSSDVTARGMDFPNVTHVIQIGLPRDREIYIHRVGRTARAGKEGEGWVIVTGVESYEAKNILRGLPLEPDTSLSTGQVDMSQPASIPPNDGRIMQDVANALKRVPARVKHDVYQATIGVSSGIRNKQVLIDSLNDLAKYGWGWDEPPALSPGYVAKLNLRGVQGIRIGERETTRFDDGRGSGGRDGFSRRGGYSGRGGFSGRDGIPRRDAPSYQGGDSRDDGFSRGRGSSYGRDRYGNDGSSRGRSFQSDRSEFSQRRPRQRDDDDFLTGVLDRR